ncbi:MAG TPA: glycoside hydrolase family 3 C-terminal domain-containing protein [Bryobacteraceae bacterium]|jgi:beta-glucosidase
MPKYRDSSATPEQRAADLVSRMTLEEKVSQMQDNAPAIERLGVPAYGWWNEALHGVARAGLATVFPQAIGLAATWDTDLQRRIANIISTEARAKYNDAIAHANHGRYHGLTFWSPNINIFRDPRWGRGQETYGEDPYLTAQMAIAFISGMQGDDLHYLKTIATSKHFAVHSGPEVSRHGFNVEVSRQDLDDTYLYAFHRTVTEAGAYSVMCAYNSINGAPACANTFLLKDSLRTAWKFSGYVVSDCGAVGDIYKGHHFAASMAEASAKAVKAGTDLDCGTEYKTLVEAVNNGYIHESEINEAVERLFVARFRLGMFDPADEVPFSKIGLDEIASSAHADVALEAAEKSIVLLKNDHNLLPLEKAPASIAVIGPASDDSDAMLGNYYGTPSHIVTPLAGIEKRFGSKTKVRWALGSVYAQSSMALVPESALTPPSDARHGVLAEYFPNDTFQGQPVLSRIESRGYFVWAMHDPAVFRVVPDPTFSVRWTATLEPPSTGDYQLGIARQECDSCPGTNSVKLYLDNRLLVNESQRSYAGRRTFGATVHLEAGKAYHIKVEYAQREGGPGVELVWAPPAEPTLREAVDLVKQSDLAILCIGLNSRLEGEESPIDIPGFSHGDRTDIRLPEQQWKLLDAVLDTGKPVIAILINGSALAVQSAKGRAAAILEAWYGGQEAGTAIANTLSGDNNPAGRLPVTFYESVDQLPPFTDYSMKNRTYRYFKGNPLYSFGYGLSYSQFSYSEKAAKQTTGGKQQLSARVTNTSRRSGDEVAQLYLSDHNGGIELKGFQRIHLGAGESKTVSFTLDPGELQGKVPHLGGNAPRR